jgi:hypothetical protein
MLKDGSYVRIVWAPQTRRGTIHLAINQQRKPQFMFRQDPRFGELDDFFIYDGDVEECARPSDEEVARILKLIDLGS